MGFTEEAISAEKNRKKPKAGRNLPMAIGVGLSLLALVGASLWFTKAGFVALVVVVVCLAIYELSGSLSKKYSSLPLVPLFVGSAGMIISTYIAGPDALMVSLMLTIATVVLWRIIDGNSVSAVRELSLSVFTVIYLPLMASFLMLLLAQDNGQIKIVLFILLAVANDVGGYVAGVFFGKHPLAPKISPKKSWEGFAGSIILATVVAVVGVKVFLDGSISNAILLGIVSTLTATLGDLFESLIKRDLGIKDMGTLLPGHGGVLDRIDSMLVSAPVVYLLLTFAI